MKISVLASTFSGNKGAAAMLQSLIKNLPDHYKYNLLSVYPEEDSKQNPYQNVKVISAKPEEMIFVAFPLAILYYLFKWLGPMRSLLLKYPILKSINESQLVVDQAGVSFVDSRGFIMNTYNFICMAIPLLLGKKVIKYSQALGPFKNFWNRLWAKMVLPKITKICARGDITYKHLMDIQLSNVELCADGAFIMPDNEMSQKNIHSIISNDNFYSREFVTISLSSVVEGYCDKTGIDYKEIMSSFINFLIEEKRYGVLIIANAARKGKTKRKNNDLPVCRKVYDRVQQKEHCRYYDEEFTPEEIREFISLSKMLVASRFHAMIGALYKEIPVLLVGWSHKYQEVLEMFSLGKYAIDYKKLTLSNLIYEFNRFEQEHNDIRLKLKENIANVQKRSLKNIEIIKDALKKV